MASSQKRYPPAEELLADLDEDSRRCMRALVDGIRTGAERAPTDDEQRRERRLKQAGMMDVCWRSTSPCVREPQSVEISFETRCGAALRFRLDRTSAEHLLETLGEALGRQEWRVQSDRSSGMPSDDGSPKEGQSE